MTLVTRRELADILGYPIKSLQTLMLRNPERWPKHRAVGDHGAYLYDLADFTDMLPHQVDSPHLRNVSTISDNDGLIVCLECGIRCHSLGKHLRTHGLTDVAYRQKHQLPATAALWADQTRDNAGRRMAADPAAKQRLAQFNDPAYLAGLQVRAVESIRRTSKYPSVRSKRNMPPVWSASVASKRAKLETAVIAAGYADLQAGIAQTVGLPERIAARKLGISASSVRRLRKEFSI